MSEQIYLSRRNLLTLLSKLDRAKKGDDTAATLIKFKVPGDIMAQSMDECWVTAIEDDVAYAIREAGVVHPKDDPNNVPNRKS